MSGNAGKKKLWNTLLTKGGNDMSKEKKTTDIAAISEMGREGYEASVMYRMQGRSGAYTPKGASGNAFEILATDKQNLENVFQRDTVTKLTKSPVAKQVDAVTMKGNKVVERIQYKDTPSASGIQKTLRQTEAGKYRQVQMKGTIETAEKFNAMAEKRGISKRMESTGISSKTTNRIGDKFTGQTPTMTSLGNVAKSSATMAAGITAGVEVLKSIENGDTLGECTGHVVSKSAESAITGAASAVAAEVAFGAASTMLASSAIPVVGPLIVAGGAALGAGALVGEVTDGIFDEIGEGIGSVVDEVGDAISDGLFEIGSFFGGLFF